jgi:hypothetical protein
MPYEIHWSDGTNLHSGDVRYSGDEWQAFPMIFYAGRVLTAFKRSHRDWQIHWSNGTNLFSGDVRYTGESAPTAMVAYTSRDGITGVHRL